MKPYSKILLSIVSFCLIMSLSACSLINKTTKGQTENDTNTTINPTTGEIVTTIKRKTDKRDLDEASYTCANMVAVDKTGRIVTSGGTPIDEHDVGIFYHIWHGAHETKGEVLDITKIMSTNPYYLKAECMDINQNKFHYWGEPLYGYYCSDDPWIITRHIELMMAMGIDYLVYDYTNNVCYDTAADLIFETLQKYYDQGFDVPKVTFYTNTGSSNTVMKLYNRYYKEGKYQDLWYAPNGKPLIIGVEGDNVAPAYRETYSYLVNEFFDWRESQWPDSKTTIENLEIGMPWMNWSYPQTNYNGYMSVSLAQHPGARMSEAELMNYGRGYDYTRMRNKSSNMEIGTNYQGQWDTVFKNNSTDGTVEVTMIMITGFNEWMAQKLSTGDGSMFVDTFSEEYSRDVEMMKGGYDDNYVIQTLLNTKNFKYTEAVHYKYDMNTIDIKDFVNSPWKNVSSIYVDMVGDAMERNFRDAFSTTTYVDNSNRNDIAKVYVTHDSANLYVAVECADDITQYNGSDLNWMNLFLSTDMNNESSFGGFNYVINRTPGTNTTTLEKSNGGYDWSKVSVINYSISGNTITFEIPLSSIGLTADNCYVWIKASDNVTNYDDIMDYYVSGDSAPIGRFAYSYGY